MRALRVFLDNSLEIAIAILRGAGMLLLLAWVGSLLGIIWTGGGGRWVATAILTFALGTVACIAGFYTFGNPEWRRGAPND